MYNKQVTKKALLIAPSFNRSFFLLLEREGRKMIKRRTRLVITLSLIILVSLFLWDKGYIMLKSEGYQALKTITQVKDSQLLPGFQSYETEHFDIQYKSQDENIVKFIADELERSYQVIGQAYDYFPKDKTLIFIYPTEQDLWNYQKSIAGEEVMGIYQLGAIHILSPNAYDLQDVDKLTYFKENGPVLHEYTHKVIDDLTGGNVELWLTEGLAVYEEYDKNNEEWAPDFSYTSYYTADDLRNNFMNLDDTQAYRQSFDIVNTLEKKYGNDKMKELLSELKHSSLDDAFGKIYGFSLNDFMNNFGENV